jgi:hypothetical protein
MMACLVLVSGQLTGNLVALVAALACLSLLATESALAAIRDRSWLPPGQPLVRPTAADGDIQVLNIPEARVSAGAF